MGTEVLRSHDCLKHRLHVDFFGSRSPPPPSLSMNGPQKKPSRSPPLKKPKRTRSKPNPAGLNRRFGSPDKENSVLSETRKQPPLIMGQVTILKRGEELKARVAPLPPAADAGAADLGSSGGDSSVLCSTNRLGPDPEILPKFSDLNAVYAGPAFISSPSPSSLPIPAFFLKKNGGEASKSEIATRGLRCLLRLDEIA